MCLSWFMPVSRVHLHNHRINWAITCAKVRESRRVSILSCTLTHACPAAPPRGSPLSLHSPHAVNSEWVQWACSDVVVIRYFGSNRPDQFRKLRCVWGPPDTLILSGAVGTKHYCFCYCCCGCCFFLTMMVYGGDLPWKQWRISEYLTSFVAISGNAASCLFQLYRRCVTSDVAPPLFCSTRWANAICMVQARGSTEEM